MTKQEAEDLVSDLIDAVKNYDGAEGAYDKRVSREQYERQRNRLIGALTSAESKS